MANTTVKTVTEMDVLKFVHDFINPLDFPAGIREKLEVMIANKEKRKTSKATLAKQEANEALKGAIIDWWMTEPNKIIRAGDLPKLIPEFAEFSTSKCSTLLRALVTEGAVERFEEKKIAYFRFVD